MIGARRMRTAVDSRLVKDVANTVGIPLVDLAVVCIVLGLTRLPTAPRRHKALIGALTAAAVAAAALSVVPRWRSPWPALWLGVAITLAVTTLPSAVLFRAGG